MEPTEEVCPVKRRFKYNCPPIYQEMIRFLNLLKADNADAKSANAEYSTTQNKEKFYSHIIATCRKPKPTQSGRSAAPAPKKAENYCFNFRQGKCNRGTHCKFSHTLESSNASSPAEISSTTDQSKPSPDTSKHPCQFFMTNGCCRKGDKCKFAHPHSTRDGNNWVDRGRSALRGVVSLEAQNKTTSQLLASKLGISLAGDDSMEQAVSKATANKSGGETHVDSDHVVQDGGLFTLMYSMCVTYGICRPSYTVLCCANRASPLRWYAGVPRGQDIRRDGISPYLLHVACCISCRISRPVDTSAT